MNLKNLTFAIFCCLVAGFSSVRGDDEMAPVVAPRDVFFPKQIRLRRCVHNGIYIPEGQTKTVAPCQYGTCNGGKVYLAIECCGPIATGCRYESTMEHCCKMICDKGCIHNGTFIPEGETKTVAPCEFASCFNGEIAIAVADCMEPKEGCRIESTMEYCCKMICDKGCMHNGIFISEGGSAKVGPCEYGSCNGGKVESVFQSCPPPKENCRYEATWDQCCNLICDGLIGLPVDEPVPAK